MKNNITRILNAIFAIIVLALVVNVAYIQYTKPEWFVVEVPKRGNVPLLDVYPSKVSNVTGEPASVCKYTYLTKSCTYYNLPTDKPYVTKTKYAFLFEHQYLVAVMLSLLFIAINMERFTQWIRTRLN